MKILAPATTANLGPGFDTLGLALALYNELEVTTTDEPGIHIEVLGEGADELPADTSHLAVKALCRVLERAGEKLASGLRLRQLNRLPLARGLGSSAAAIVAGVVAGVCLLRLEGVDVVAEATALEGHPDNVAPCYLGGLVASCQSGERTFACGLPIHECWRVAVAVPEFQLTTARARAALPDSYTRQQAVFNLARLPLLTAGLAQGRGDLVREGTRDAIHQPYRLELIPGAAQVIEAACEAGADGAFISGAGPTMAALVDARRHQPEAVGQAMVEAFGAAGVKAASQTFEVDRQGCRILT